MLEQPRSVEEIVSAVRARFAGVDAVRAEEDVQRALEELRKVECVVSSA